MGNFKIFRSSAGSGKTYTLTREYIKLAIASPRLGPEAVRDDYFRRILAITFTNDAAKEMKERIVSELDKLSQLDHSAEPLKALWQEIEKEYPSAVENPKELKHRCYHVLRAILHNYSDFSVSTIDSFATRLGESFKKDLGLPYNYEIQLDLRQATQLAVEQLISLAGKPQFESLTNWLILFIEKQLEDGKNWNIENSLIQIAGSLFDEKKQKILEAISSKSMDDFVGLDRQIKVLKSQFKDRLVALAQQALDKIAANGLEKADFSRGSLFVYFEKIAAAEFGAGLSTSLQNQVEARNFGTKKNANPTIEQISVELAEIVEQIEQLKSTGLGQFTLLNELSKHIYQFALLSRVEQLLQEQNAAHRWVHLAELNKKIAQVIENEPVPFIYERLGERYYHIMIDEFQDTSEQQWQNLLVLVCNALSQATVSLVVGDTKQAIYRWRGGKASMLSDLPNIPATNNLQKLQNARILHQEACPMVLEYNYRSSYDVVEFNNRFFEFLVGNYAEQYPLLSRYYTDFIQIPAKQNLRGFVKIEELNSHSDHIRRCAELVKLLQTEGVALQDIAILCDKNKQATALASYLLAENISVVTAESLLVSQSASVGLVVRMLKILLNTTDTENKGYFLLHLKAISGATVGDQALAQAARLRSLYGFFAFLKEHFAIELSERKLSFLPLFQKIVEIVRVFKLPVSAGEQPFLQKFLDFALEHSEKKSQSLSEFIAAYESTPLSINLSQGTQAVKIMSIHKSKGLQFAYVIVPFADWRISSNDNEIWAHWPQSPLHDFPFAVGKTSSIFFQTDLATTLKAEKNEEDIEQINKLYVALTRAEKGMYILHKKREEGRISNLLSEFRLHAGASTFGEQAQFYPSPKVEENQVFNSFSYMPLQDFALRTDSKPLGEDVGLSERQRGELVHALMEQIQVPQDVEEVFGRAAAERLLPKEQIQNLIENLKTIFAIPEVGLFFSEQSKWLTEPEIVVKEKGITKLFRPDKLVFLGQKIAVIDYKTGSKHHSYRQQVDHYAQLVGSIYPSPTVKMLLYLDLAEAEIW